MTDSSSPPSAEAQSGLIDQFCEVTGSSRSRARHYLEDNGWMHTPAVESYFEDDDPDENPSSEAASRPSASAADQTYTGPRTLDGRPAPQSTVASSGSSKKPSKKKGLATLSDLGASGHDHDDDDDDDEDDDDDDRRGPRDLFAGGEKSGLAVQDPSRKTDPQNVIKDILAKAKANAQRATTEEDSPGPSRPSNFRGSGVTVGGEGTESRRIPDPRATATIPAAAAAATPRGEELPVVTRTLHLWRDGFSIEDGPLRRFSDPEHAMDLQMIRSGRAPLHLMDVEHGQRCDVRLQQHDEDWHQLPRIYRPFAGQGHRLGSPVPGEGSGSSAPAPAVPTASSAQPPSTPAAPTNVDSSQPTVGIRFQMPDGSRLPARFNLTNTIGDLYQFAANTAPEMRSRTFVIQSTFPSKEHTDREQTLGDIDAFKRGGIAVVKWA